MSFSDAGLVAWTFGDPGNYRGLGEGRPQSRVICSYTEVGDGDEDALIALWWLTDKGQRRQTTRHLAGGTHLVRASVEALRALREGRDWPEGSVTYTS